MSATKNTSLYNQRDDITNKWKVKDVNGVVAENGDIHSFDINKEKANYGLYGYGSADEMYSAYNNDLNFVNRINELDMAKQEQMDAAKKAESQKLQYADTRRTLMEKYIPETLLAHGVANTGYTADALLKAENNYNQYVLGAMNEKANTEQNALKAYQDAYALAKQERDQKAYENFVEANKTQNKLYSDAITAIEDEGSEVSMDYINEMLKAGGASQETIDKVNAYYNTQLGKAQDEVYKEFTAAAAENKLTYEDVVNAEKKKAISSEQAAELKNLLIADDATIYSKEGVVTESKGGINGEGDKFTVEIGNAEYTLKTGTSIWKPKYEEGGTVYGERDYTPNEIAVWNMITEARNSNPNAYPNGTVFVYNDTMYVVDDDNANKIYTVKDAKKYKAVWKQVTGSKKKK